MASPISPIDLVDKLGRLRTWKLGDSVAHPSHDSAGRTQDTQVIMLIRDRKYRAFTKQVSYAWII